jgi:hypothetical protein
MEYAVKGRFIEERKVFRDVSIKYCNAMVLSSKIIKCYMGVCASVKNF